VNISGTNEVGLRSGASFEMRDGRNLYDFIFYGTAPATESVPRQSRGLPRLPE
jgi:hypothetical protein